MPEAEFLKLVKGLRPSTPADDLSRLVRRQHVKDGQTVGVHCPECGTNTWEPYGVGYRCWNCGPYEETTPTFSHGKT